MGAPAKPKRVLKIEKQERQQRILELRKTGATFQQIANQLNMDVSQCYNEFKQVMAEINAQNKELAESHLALELARLDALQLQLMADLKRNEGKEKLNYSAVNALLRLSEQRAKLLGLNAPVKTETELSGAVSWRQLVEAASEAVKDEPNPDGIKSDWGDTE